MTALIIGAMDKEIARLVSGFNAVQSDEGIYTGTVKTNTVIIAVSGVGKVNAASTTQRLIDKYSPDLVINTGVAGGIAKDISLGETVIASYLTYHDFDPLELFERYPPFSKHFTCDKRLIELAEKACDSIGAKHRTGVIVSGDCFVNDIIIKETIQNRFGAECTEMEGAAIAHTCMLNNVPFVIIRAVCDFADSSADMINSFETQAADNAAAITEYIINNL